MKRTAFFRCMVCLLIFGIMAMSLIGCEGPAGPAGATGSVPSFLQGTTWVIANNKFEFFADKFLFTNSGSTPFHYTGMYATFTFEENPNGSTKGTYPGGYRIDYLVVDGTGDAAILNNTALVNRIYFNAGQTAFVLNANTVPYTKQ